MSLKDYLLIGLEESDTSFIEKELEGLDQTSMTELREIILSELMRKGHEPYPFAKFWNHAVALFQASPVFWNSLLQEIAKDDASEEDVRALLKAAICYEHAPFETSDGISYLGSLIIAYAYRHEELYASFAVQAEVSSFLFSVTNRANEGLRRDLVHFYAYIYHKTRKGDYLEKVMHRFGFNVLQTDFTELFASKDQMETMLVPVLSLSTAVLALKGNVQNHLFHAFSLALLSDPKFFAVFFDNLILSLEASGALKNEVLSQNFLVHMHNLGTLACRLGRRSGTTEILAVMERIWGITQLRESVDVMMATTDSRGQMLRLLKQIHRYGTRTFVGSLVKPQAKRRLSVA